MDSGLSKGKQMIAQLEHTNFTVADADVTAKWMCDLFGWHIRWAGASLAGGRSVHVGTDTHYLALYTPLKRRTPLSTLVGAVPGALPILGGWTAPTFEETFVFDFNRAFSPLCNYSPAYNCAIPPPENHLGVAILAGEKTYPR